MSQDARRARRAGRVVLQLYRDHAPIVEDARARMGVTCKAGCSHCCKLPATATVPEMVPVVDHLSNRCDWLRRKPALERELNKQLAEFATIDVLNEHERASFFQRQLPCVFLKDDRCETPDQTRCLPLPHGGLTTRELRARCGGSGHRARRPTPARERRGDQGCEGSWRAARRTDRTGVRARCRSDRGEDQRGSCPGRTGTTRCMKIERVTG